MYRIDFISAECYPAAKVGGLADVVGSLPKYINQVRSHLCQVIMPFYGTDWFKKNTFETVFSSTLTINHVGKTQKRIFHIKRLMNNDLGFPLFCIDLPGLFDRNGIYAENNVFFEDEPERNICFQRAYLEWILDSTRPDIIHCHDHHTGLIPYMLIHSTKFSYLRNIPTVFTIHNGQYHGAFSWDYEYLLESSPDKVKGLLDWNKGINSLSSAIRCAWRITTVSPNYMRELALQESTFQELYIQESDKSQGILNGIDYDVWNAETDPYLNTHLKNSLTPFKSKNKKQLCELLGLDPQKPLISFIGRFAHEKGVDIISNILPEVLKKNTNILILGTGDSNLEDTFKGYNVSYSKNFRAELKYDEALAHQIYAGSDFLLMPSRVEPCGLNQMYAMRYATIPIVHAVGGLQDTVTNLDTERGTGIKFSELSEHSLLQAMYEAIALFKNKKRFNQIRENAFQQDFSWNASCHNYLKLYYELKNFN